MKGIKNNLIKTGYMTTEQKIQMAWNDLTIAVHDHNFKNVGKYYWTLKYYLGKYEEELTGEKELPVIE